MLEPAGHEHASAAPTPPFDAKPALHVHAAGPPTDVLPVGHAVHTSAAPLPLLEKFPPQVQVALFEPASEKELVSTDAQVVQLGAEAGVVGQLPSAFLRSVEGAPNVFATQNHVYEDAPPTSFGVMVLANVGSSGCAIASTSEGRSARAKTCRDETAPEKMSAGLEALPFHPMRTVEPAGSESETLGADE